MFWRNSNFPLSTRCQTQRRPNDQETLPFTFLDLLIAVLMHIFLRSETPVAVESFSDMESQADIS